MTLIPDLNDSKEWRAKYRGLLEAAPDAMVVVNPSGELVLMNVQAEKQFGYGRDEFLGQKVQNIIPQGFAERLIADGTRTAAGALAQQIGAGIELQGRRQDGTAFPIEIMLRPLDTTEGILVTAAIRDITKRKRVEDALRQSEERFRSITSGVKDYANIMLDPEGLVVGWNEGAERVNGYHAEEIIGLLSYSHSGSTQEPLSETSSQDALQKALRNLHATLEASGAIVTHDSLPDILTDETQLVQVFQNLVGNAVKYHGEEAPHVHVSAAREGNDWIFSVRDNGLGIESQSIERIFILFQRLHGQTDFQGTGSGLAMCRKIVDRLGRRIWVESQPRQGSTFYFTLPAGDGK